MRDVMKLIRTLHIYASMFGLIVLLFFAVTGYTLNHAQWFGLDQPHERQVKGKVDVAALKAPDKLAVVEALRRDLHVTGSLAAFDTSDEECTLDFHGPGASARVTIDRATGDAEAASTHYGAVAVLNALHQGRDSGAGWSLLIDLTAGLMVFVSASGIVLLLTLPKRRRLGLVAMVVGFALCVAVYCLCVP